MAGATRRLAVPLGLALVLVPGPAASLAGQNAADTEQEPTAADTLPADSLIADSLPGDTIPEAITQERSGTDEDLRSSLQAIFDRVESLADVTVEVEAGIVRLGGTVASLTALERAEDLVRSREGVLWVENEVRLTTSLSERLEPTWERLTDHAFGVVAALPLLAVALLIVLLGLVTGSALGRWGGPSFLRSRNPFLQNIVGRAIQAAVVLAGIVVALDLLDATALVGAVAGTAGLAGLALGFAFKEIVENYLAGVLLAFRRPFEQSDYVVVEGFEGKVVRLTPRETILMTLEGNHVRVPNSLVFGSPMVNYTRNPRRRFHFDFGVGASDDLAVAREEGVSVLRDMDGVLVDPPPSALILDLGDSSVSVRFMGWVDQRNTDFARARSEAIRLVKARLEAVGVSLPSPEYLVQLQEPSAGGGREGGASPVPAPAEAQEDVSVDDTLDRQIEEEREESRDPNLLEKDGRPA